MKSSRCASRYAHAMRCIILPCCELYTRHCLIDTCCKKMMRQAAHAPFSAQAHAGIKDVQHVVVEGALCALFAARRAARVTARPTDEGETIVWCKEEVGKAW